MKKIAFIFFMIIVSLYASDNSLTFSDVPKDHWAYKAIQNLVDEGVISTNTKLFNGEIPISRYEFADELNRSFKTLDEKKANRGDLVLLESLVYEFSKELTKIGFDTDVFNGKIENLRIDVELIREKNRSMESRMNELSQRLDILENKVGL